MISREQLIKNLNEDSGQRNIRPSLHMWCILRPSKRRLQNIAKELEVHATEELAHALIISKQIDYLGGDQVVTPKPVKTSEKAVEMLRFDLENETETIRQYRERVRQCEALGEFAMAEHIREILIQEQEHQIDLATALGEDPPDNSG